ncbi:MAG: hypothetical protein IPK13_04050 [Deltaproteobacteria bacterium]|nr:hypothetical protein [Deltaproteobacteria bacterium]
MGFLLQWTALVIVGRALWDGVRQRRRDRMPAPAYVSPRVRVRSDLSNNPVGPTTQGSNLALALAVAGWALPLIAATISWRRAFLEIKSVNAVHAFAERLALLERGLAHHLSTSNWTSWSVFAACLLGALIFALDANERYAYAPRLERLTMTYAPGAAGLLFGFLAAAAALFTEQVRRSFNTIDDSNSSDRTTQALHTLAEARVLLDGAAATALIGGIFVVIMIASALTRTKASSPPAEPSTRGSERSAPRRVSARRILLAVAAMMLLGIYFSVEVWSFAEENEAEPLPITQRGRFPFSPSVTTPQIEGPDVIDADLERELETQAAPTIALSPDHVEVAGFSRRISNVASALIELREVQTLRQAKSSFSGAVLFLVDRNVDGQRLKRVLRATEEAGYGRVYFLFVIANAISRPLLGDLETLHTTSVSAWLRQTSEAKVIEIPDRERFNETARRIVDAQANGAPIVVLLVDE